MKVVDFSNDRGLQQYSLRLFEENELSHFKHTRLYKDYKTIVLLSNPECSSNIFQNHKFSLSNDLCETLKVKIHLRVDQGVSLVIVKNNYTDIFDFVCSNETQDHTNFYNENKQYIKKLIKNYLDIFANTLKGSKRHPYGIGLLRNDGEIFTEREKECVRLLMEGNTAKMTAKKLNISHRTVEKHLDNVKEKLKVKRKIEIMHKIENMNITNL